MAIITVDTLDDTVAADGLTSLREAITAANATAAADTIEFAAGLNGTIRVASLLPTITEDLTIDGDGRITITGDVNGDDTVTNGLTDLSATAATELDDNVRVLLGGGDDTVILDGLIITGGRSTSGGGGISMGSGTLGDVTIKNSIIAGNHTTGQYSNGGGISVFGSLVVENSAVYSNHTEGTYAGGGGIYASVNLSMTNSTVADNSTQYFGGGIMVGSGTSTLENVTITGNAAGEKGGGIRTSNLTIKNSIILGNHGGDGDVEAQVISTLTASGMNIIGENGTDFDASGDTSIVNAATSGVFATTANNNGSTAGVIANNGGGIHTVALLSDRNNVALDASTTTLVGNAPNGVARAFDLDVIDNGGTVDLGAFELGTQVLTGPDMGAVSNPVRVDENQVAVVDLSTTDDVDSEGSGLTYALTGGADQLRFAIDANTGALSFLSAPDFENPTDADFDNVYNVQVTVTDSDGFRDVQDITVQVDNVLLGDDDFLIGTNGADMLRGFGGNDRILGRKGGDTLRGDEGRDTLWGEAGNDKLFGGDDNDILSGGEGVDQLSGDGGKDTLDGGAGADIMAGGGGDDTYWVDNAKDSVREAKGGGKDIVATTLAKYTLAANAETLVGMSKTGQTLKGNGLANLIGGQNGADTISGAAGNDTISGSGGKDILSGGGGKDRILGGAGNDVIRGDAGNDLLVGQGGKDKFVFKGKFGKDRVADFKIGQDKIDVRAIKDISAFSDLTIRKDKKGNAIVDFGTDEITVLGVKAGQLDAGDFLL